MTIKPKYKFILGYAFGHRQPSMLVRLSVDPDCNIDAGVARVSRLSMLHPDTKTGASLDSIPKRIAELIGFFALRLQRDAGIAVFASPYSCLLSHHAGEKRSPSELTLTYPCPEPDACTAAIDWVVAAIFSSLEDEPLTERLSALRAKLKKFALVGLNQMHFLETAHQEGIPARALLKPLAYVFGEGSASIWLSSTITDQTPSLGVSIATDKLQCSAVMRAHGMPVPDHIAVASADQAVQAARRLGFPVVVKPSDLEQGMGVSAGLTTEAVVAEAYSYACRFSKKILVEKHVHGQDFRLTAMHGKVIKVMQRIPGGVTGDGQSSVQALIEQAQTEPAARRRFLKEGKHRLCLDEEALSVLTELNMTPDSILTAGRFLALRRKSNISSGGTQTVIAIETVHPNNLELACRATEVLGLDIAGVDLLVPDIGISWKTSGGAICEINAAPQIGASDTPRIFSEMLAALLPTGGRIPTYLQICIDLPPETESRMAHHWAAESNSNGISMRGEVVVNGTAQGTAPTDGLVAGKRVLIDRRVRSAVVSMTERDLLTLGMPSFSWTSVRLLRRGKSGGATDVPPDLRAVLAPHKCVVVSVVC